MSTRNSRSFTHRSRDGIIAAKIIGRLIKFVNGEIDMTWRWMLEYNEERDHDGQ
jgi:hypothetical protein